MNDEEYRARNKIWGTKNGRMRGKGREKGEGWRRRRHTEHRWLMCIFSVRWLPTLQYGSLN